MSCPSVIVCINLSVIEQCEEKLGKPLNLDDPATLENLDGDKPKPAPAPASKRPVAERVRGGATAGSAAGPVFPIEALSPYQNK